MSINLEYINELFDWERGLKILFYPEKNMYANRIMGRYYSFMPQTSTVAPFTNKV